MTPCTAHCTVKAIITMGRFLYLYFDNSLTLFCSVFPSPSVFVFLEIFQTPLSRSFRNSVLAVNWWFGLSSTIANRNSCSSGSFFFHCMCTYMRKLSTTELVPYGNVSELIFKAASEPEPVFRSVGAK